MSHGALSLERVHIAVGGRTLVDGLDLEVAAGQCTTLMGPSGCGKSTLLAYVAGSLGPPFEASGRVVVDGEDLTGRPRSAGASASCSRTTCCSRTSPSAATSRSRSPSACGIAASAASASRRRSRKRTSRRDRHRHGAPRGKAVAA